MKTRIVTLMLSLAAMLCMVSVSMAAPVASWDMEIDIIGYDILSTLPLEDRVGPGGVGTSAYYTGTVTSAAGGLKNYTGGGGTLNDGVTDGGINDGQQMFQAGVMTTIQLYFDPTDLYTINGLLFSGGDPFSGDFLPNNSLPGGLTGMGMVVGAVSTEVLDTVEDNFVAGPYPFLYNGDDDQYVDDYIDLTGDEFALLREEQVTSIILNFFTAAYNSGANAEVFTLSEIQVFGSVVVPEEPTPEIVPEPSTIILLGLGLVGLAVVSRKRLSGNA